MHTILNNTAPEYLTSRIVRRCDLTSYNLIENEYKLGVPQPRTEFYKRSLSYSGSVLWNGLPLEVRQLTSSSIFKGNLREFRLTNNLIKRYSVFTHGLLEKQVFSFHLYYFSFYLSFRLVRKLVFLYFNVNVYLMAIPCLNKVTIPYHTILRPGELHICMAMLRTIGAYGIDMCWVESELYGPSTVRQILDGNHVKRGENAHIITLQALFTLYQEAFFKQHQELHETLQSLAQEFCDACKDGTGTRVKKAHMDMVSAIDNLNILEKMLTFEAANANNPMFKVMRHYMRMVMEMLAFIGAVRTRDWSLHLITLEMFTKFFFANDKKNYARMIPVYLAEMSSLNEADQEIYEEFIQGNWVVNKNAQVPFCAVGADNALEHINRSMKASGGLIGITLNEAARTKLFLIAPELARLAEQAKKMAGLSSKTQGHHHNLTTAVLAREEKGVAQLTATIERFTNPFSDTY